MILLDLHGSHWDSETFAEKLGNWQTASSALTFVIAGSLGPSPALVSRANARWKLSDLTFTHLMTRVLVLEQIYRAYMKNCLRAPVITGLLQMTGASSCLVRRFMDITLIPVTVVAGYRHSSVATRSA